MFQSTQMEICLCIPPGLHRTSFNMYYTTQGVHSNRSKCLHSLVGAVEYCESQNVTPYQKYRPEFKLQFLPKTEQEKI